MSHDFARVMLQPEQEDLLRRLVDVDRNISQPDHRDSLFVRTIIHDEIILPESSGRSLTVYQGDVEALTEVGLLRGSTESSEVISLSITPFGHGYYAWLKERDGEALRRVEHTVQRYLNAEDFQQKHPRAFSRWTRAEDLLQSYERAEDLTTVGHLCREAVQEFADDLVTEFAPIGTTFAKELVFKRLAAVLDVRKDKFGSTELPFLESLFSYWNVVVDLIQRQEHGALREGEPLVLEDARRVVFQTAVVMFEIDRSLSRR